MSAAAVGRDAGRAVTMHRPVGDGYRVRATTPLSWTLDTTPADPLF